MFSLYSTENWDNLFLEVMTEIHNFSYIIICERFFPLHFLKAQKHIFFSCFLSQTETPRTAGHKSIKQAIWNDKSIL